MKKVLYSVGLLGALVLINLSCEKKEEDNVQPEPAVKPVADFEIIGDGQVSPAEVRFVSKAENANTHSWEFGDGATSRDKDPTHVFNNNGVSDTTFYVKLTVRNGDNSDYRSRALLVKPKPRDTVVTKKGDLCNDWFLSAHYEYKLGASDKGPNKKPGMKVCELDNILRIECNSEFDGYLKELEGPTKFDPNDPDILDQGSWTMNSAKTELTYGINFYTFKR